jgi:hypothetical protein
MIGPIRPNVGALAFGERILELTHPKLVCAKLAFDAWLKMATLGSKQPWNCSKLKVQILGTICRGVASNIVSLRHPPFILRAHSMVLAASLRLEKLCNTVPKDGNEPMLEMRLYFAAIAPNSSSASLTRLI